MPRVDFRVINRIVTAGVLNQFAAQSEEAIFLPVAKDVVLPQSILVGTWDHFINKRAEQKRAQEGNPCESFGRSHADRFSKTARIEVPNNRWGMNSAREIHSKSELIAVVLGLIPARMMLESELRRTKNFRARRRG